MIVPLREDQWRTPITHRLDDVVANSTSAKLVVDQRLVDSLELDTLVSIWTSLRLERGRLHEDIVLEGMGRCLHSRVHAMPHCMKRLALRTIVPPGTKISPASVQPNLMPLEREQLASPSRALPRRLSKGIDAGRQQ